MKKRSILFVLFGQFFATQFLAAADGPSTNEPVRLPTVTVLGTNSPSLTAPSLEQARKQYQQVPGGFTITGVGQFERGRGSSVEDLLEGIPGVNLQSQNGMEATKISIRGSGILSDDEPLGLQVLLDGFTFNQGDGEVILEDFDLGGVKSAEVYRGANAFKYGSISLGGAINLTSKTGYDADRFSLRVEGGSFGFVRAQASSGGVEGPMDYFASVSGRSREGYRQHSAENTEDLFSNFGYKFNENTENRFYLTIARTDRQVPGALSKEELTANPRQAVPDNIAQDANKGWYYLRLADKVSYKNDNEEADAGGYWWHRQLEERGLFNEDNPEGIQDYYSDNFGILLNSVTHFHLFNLPNNLTIGANPTLEVENDGDFQNNDGHKGAVTGGDSELSINAPIYMEDQQYVTEQLSLIAGLQAIHVKRHLTDRFNKTDSGDQTASVSFRTINPKAGIIWEINKKSQVYANFSRSWQPPSFDNMLDFDDDNPPPPFGTGSLVFSPLEPQRAWTAEIGTRGEAGRFEWELSLYHSWVRDELLEVNNSSGVDIGAVNIRRSYHQGIEAGLETELFNSIFTEKSGDEPADKLSLRQTYTLSDFHFDGDPVYGDNRIAGVPIHLYEAELMYESPWGFYAGPNVQWNVTRYPADHANTLYASSYALVGFKAGFQFRKHFSIFFEARNLSDQHYAAAVDPIPDARTGDDPIQIFHPGDGRAFYGGASVRF
ncbi:MAG TPA: TonB-dependent receptor [Verrucomicrobiae bacterium]|nr:TonB-dependent receptor [Verrucomicrobiae bacterium]